MVPRASRLDTISIRHDSAAMLFALVPLALVLSTIWPSECSLSVLGVLLVLTLMLGSIWPSHGSIPVHVPVLPSTLELSAISEDVVALSIHLIITELPLKPHSCARLVDTSTMLVAMLKVAFISCSISPQLLAFPALLVIQPFAFVGAAV